MILPPNLSPHDEKQLEQLERLLARRQASQSIVLTAWGLLFPVVLALGWFVLGVPFLKVIGFWIGVALFVVLVG